LNKTIVDSNHKVAKKMDFKYKPSWIQKSRPIQLNYLRGSFNLWTCWVGYFL